MNIHWDREGSCDHIKQSIATDIVLRYKKERMPLLIEVPKVTGENPVTLACNTLEIRNMLK